MCTAFADLYRRVGVLRWKPGTLALWDNIAVQHKATFDYDPLPRLLYRTTVRGPAVV